MASFKFVLSDDVLRKLNKQEYKATMHWLRVCRREVDKQIDWDKVDRALIDMLIYGGYILFED